MQLVDFDQKYFDSFKERESFPSSEKAVYHTVILDNEKVGIVGYLPAKFPADAGFIQVLIEPKFRGRGLAGQAEELLIKKYGLKTVFATIKKENSASLKAHQKNGFKKLSEHEMSDLRHKGFLEEDEIRMIKNY